MPSPRYRLYHYWRSTSSWRVRWALSLKGLDYEAIPVNLLNGESESSEHRARNPAGFVPVLELPSPGAQPVYLTESLAIVEYLDANHPSPRLIPAAPLERARVWALAEVINAGTQPLQNVPVFQLHSPDPVEQKKWNQHWIRNGLEIYEKLVASVAGDYSFGNHLTVADLCLMPQLYNADRFEVPWQDLPTISRIRESCLSSAGYEDSHPNRFKPAEFA